MACAAQCKALLIASGALPWMHACACWVREGGVLCLWLGVWGALMGEKEGGSWTHAQSALRGTR